MSKKLNHDPLIIVKTTYPNLTKAKSLGKVLLAKKLAACIQFCKIESLYRWQGNIERANEILVSIKSTESHFQKIEQEIKKHHPYTTPQILSISTTDVAQNYYNWVQEELK